MTADRQRAIRYKRRKALDALLLAKAEVARAKADLAAIREMCEHPGAVLRAHYDGSTSRKCPDCGAEDF